MYKFVILLLYIFFSGSFYIKNFVKSLILHNLEIINISIVIILILILYYSLLLKFKNKLVYFLTKHNTNLYFSNYFDVIKSFIFLVFFTLYYVIYLRIMIFFTQRSLDINFYNLFNSSKIILSEKSLMLIFLVVILMYLTIFCVNFTIVFFAKKNYLKFHYYYFLRKSFYRKVLESIVNFELSISNYFFYNYYVLLKFHGFRILIIFLFFYSLFIDNGDLSKVLRILPYYAIYYFFLNINNYIIYILKYDFDILIIESYYRSINFLMERNEEKKKEYIKFLLSNRSKYRFQDSIMLLYKLDKDVLVIEIYKYTNNKKPNDFYTLIGKKKPIFI